MGDQSLGGPRNITCIPLPPHPLKTVKHWYMNGPVLTSSFELKVGSNYWYERSVDELLHLSYVGMHGWKCYLSRVHFIWYQYSCCVHVVLFNICEENKISSLDKARQEWTLPPNWRRWGFGKLGCYNFPILEDTGRSVCMRRASVLNENEHDSWVISELFLLKRW